MLQKAWERRRHEEEKERSISVERRRKVGKAIEEVLLKLERLDHKSDKKDEGETVKGFSVVS